MCRPEADSGLSDGGRSSIGARGRRGDISSPSAPLSNSNQVLLTRSILGVPRVKLDDALDGVIGSNVDWHGVLGDEEGEAFGARWGGEGAGVLEDAGGVKMLLDGIEVEGSGLSTGTWSGDFLDIAGSLGKELGGGARLGKLEGEGNDGYLVVCVKSVKSWMF